MPTPKPQHEIYKTRIEALGGVDAVVEELQYSTMVGFTYHGDMRHLIVEKVADENAMHELVTLACFTAICWLQCLVAGIACTVEKSNGHG